MKLTAKAVERAANASKRSWVTKVTGGDFVTVSLDVGHDAGCTSTTFTRGGSAEEANSLPVGTVFDLLSDDGRRHLLYYLIDEAGGEAETADLVDHLHGAASGTGSVEFRGGQIDRESILVELHHRHLPKMEEAGLVEYDGRDGAVRYVEDPLVEDCLARVAARDFGQQP